MNQDARRSLWNAVALIATLGLALVVAVVAVTRSDRSGSEAAPSPSASASPSPSPSAPRSLAGKGPYLIYALSSGEVLAYDVADERWVEMGELDDDPVPQRLRQPGEGDVVAFATAAGTVWRVDREGLERVAILPSSDGRSLEGGAVSRDGRRLAVASTGADPELFVVNLVNGRTLVAPRETGSGNRYPDEPLVPVGWSLGGSLVYQVPACPCEDESPGLYVYDLDAERSTVISATARVDLVQPFAISPDGQELVWSELDEPPYTLRRLSAGRQSATTLRRDDDERVANVVWSAEGEWLFLTTLEPDAGRFSHQLADPETGDRERTVGGLPRDAIPLALLPEGVLVYLAGPGAGRSLQVLADGGTSVVAEPDAGPVFLGWIR